MSDKKYLIWSFANRAWWGPNGRGYTDTISLAGRYAKDDAKGPAGVVVPAPEFGGKPTKPRQLGWPEGFMTDVGAIAKVGPTT